MHSAFVTDKAAASVNAVTFGRPVTVALINDTPLRLAEISAVSSGHDECGRGLCLQPPTGVLGNVSHTNNLHVPDGIC